MIALFIKLIFVLVITLMVGYFIVHSFLYREHCPLWAKLGLAYGMGLGFVTHVMLLLAFFQIPLKLENIIWGIGGSLVFLIFMMREKFSQRKLFFSFHWHWPRNLFLDGISFICICYIAYQVFLVFWWAANMPVFSWDTYYNYATKAKLIFFSESLKDLPYFTWPSYPLLVPLSMVWVGLGIGEWHLNKVNIIFPLAYLSYLSIQYFFLSHFVNRRWSLFGLVLLTSSTFFTFHGALIYTDFFMLYFNTTTIMLLVLWYKKKMDAWLWLAAIFSGFGAFVKLEGSAYAIIHYFLLLFILWKMKESMNVKMEKFFKFLLTGSLIYSIFFIYKWFFGLPVEGKTSFDFGIQQLVHIKAFLSVMPQAMFLTWSWNILWFMFFIVTILNMRRIKKYTEIQIFLCALIVFYAFIFCLATFSNHSYHLVGAGSGQGLFRIMLHSFPLVTILIVLMSCPEDDLKIS